MRNNCSFRSGQTLSSGISHEAAVAGSMPTRYGQSVKINIKYYMEINTIFNDFAKAFEKKINKGYFIRVQFEIYDMKNEIWQVDVNNGNIFIYNEEKINPEEIFTLSKDTLIRLYNNELAPLTAFAQEPNENGEYCALIDWKDKEVKKTYPNSKQANEVNYKEKVEFLNRLAEFFYSKIWFNTPQLAAAEGGSAWEYLVLKQMF
jgi:hypothetical protein